MAHTYPGGTAGAIWQAINSNEFYIHSFIAIDISEAGFAPLYFTDYPTNYTLGGNLYVADQIKGITTPPKTGQIAQEVQRMVFAQGLSWGIWDGNNFPDAAGDIIKLFGNNFHAAKIVTESYVQPANGSLIETAPVIRAEGIIKSISRNAEADEVIVDYTNAFGKLDTLRELRTTPGSLRRRDTEDTTFDSAHKNVSKNLLEWGT